MPRSHRTYDDDFHREAVNLLIHSGRPLKRVAAELGISANSLRTWRDKALDRGREAEAASAQRCRSIRPGDPPPPARGRVSAPPV